MVALAIAKLLPRRARGGARKIALGCTAGVPFFYEQLRNR